jgi:hypothetical protein
MSLQSMAIIPNVVSTNPADGEVYSIPRYVIKFVRNVWQVGIFSLILENICQCDRVVI